MQHPVQLQRQFFFSKLGGIRNDGIGFDKFVIQPFIPDDLDQMHIVTQSVYGKIVNSYRRLGNGIKFSFEVPANSESTIVVPLVDDSTFITENGKEIEPSKNGIISVSYIDGQAVIRAYRA